MIRPGCFFGPFRLRVGGYYIFSLDFKFIWMTLKSSLLVSDEFPRRDFCPRGVLINLCLVRNESGYYPIAERFGRVRN